MSRQRQLIRRVIVGGFVVLFLIGIVHAQRPAAHWSPKIIEATLTDKLEHLDKPADWRWLVLWLELSPGSGSLLTKDIIVTDDTGERYGPAGMDCEVPPQSAACFRHLLRLQRTWPGSRPQRPRFVEPVLYGRPQESQTHDRRWSGLRL